MEQQNKTQKAFERIEQGVKDVYTSDNFKQYLKMLTKFHDYSLNNTILILSQKPDATLVAGYNSWKENFHRHVNIGEKAIQILAPYQVTVKIKDFDSNNINNLDEESSIENTEDKTIKITRFRPVNVFDISQTDGQPLPSLVHELQGTSEEIKAIIASIQEISSIEIKYIPTYEDETLLAGAKGYYHKGDDYIVVDDNLEDLQKCKTLIHEFAHSLLHKQTDKNSNQREIEAESLAFVICDYFGIDTSDYSFGYIASYANGDIEEMKNILNEIQTNAHEIIERLEPVYKEKLQELSSSLPLQIDYDLARRNYENLYKIAKPLLDGDAHYMRFSTKEYMDLIIENIGDNKIAMAHFYELNDDLMADPDIEFVVDHENKYLIADSFQQDNLAYFERANDNPIIINDLNDFTSNWLSNIKAAHYKIEEIYTEDAQYNMSENPKELKQYCKEHGVMNIVRKEKEFER